MYVRRFLVASLLLFTVADAYATCSLLSYNLEEARIQLARAAMENDFDFARIYASRAQGALDDVASSALDCRCSTAQSEFGGSAARTRKARDSGSAPEFASELNNAVRDFNAGIAALRVCAADGTLKKPS